MTKYVDRERAVLLQELERSNRLVASMTEQLEQRPGQSEAWMRIYQAEREHLTRVVRTVLVMDFDPLQVQLAEGQLDILFRVTAGVLDYFGLNPNDPQVQQATSRTIIAIFNADRALRDAAAPPDKDLIHIEVIEPPPRR